MDTKKIIGYVFSLLGLVGILASSGNLKEKIPFLANISTMNILIVSGIIVVAGIALIILSGNSTVKQSPEVPIYEGKGKKRKVVAYQRMKK